MNWHVSWHEFLIEHTTYCSTAYKFSTLGNFIKKSIFFCLASKSQFSTFQLPERRKLTELVSIQRVRWHKVRDRLRTLHVFPRARMMVSKRVEFSWKKRDMDKSAINSQHVNYLHLKQVWLNWKADAIVGRIHPTQLLPNTQQHKDELDKFLLFHCVEKLSAGDVQSQSVSNFHLSPLDLSVAVVSADWRAEHATLSASLVICAPLLPLWFLCLCLRWSLLCFPDPRWRCLLEFAVFAVSVALPLCKTGGRGSLPEKGY